MKHFLLVLVFLPHALLAQLISQPEKIEDDFLMTFNEEFISSNNISKITISHWRKRQGSTLKKMDSELIRHFRPDGTVERQLMIKTLFGKADTTLTYSDERTWLQHSASGCKLKRTFETEEKEIRTYACACKIVDEQVVILDSNWVSTEKVITREINPTTTRIEYIHDERPFLHETIIRDSLGYVLEISSTYLATRQKEKSTFAYDHLGRLQRIDEQSDLSKKSRAVEYSYDQFGSLTSYSFWSNGEKQRDGEIVIGDTALPDGAVDQKPNGVIIMYKFTYEYYD